MKAGLYVHIPFCEKKCNYCDFNSVSMGSNNVTPALYVDALLKEAELRLPKSECKTVFLGGGTPSVLPGKEIKKLIDGLRKFANIPSSLEFSMEANPGTLDPAKLALMRETGVNRLSLGLQSTDDKLLKMLGRIHTYKEFLVAFSQARKAGFKNINIDLIFGVPGQDLKGLRQDLKRIIALSPEHISIYNLSLEEGTPLAKQVKNGELRVVDDGLQADMYYEIKDFLEQVGFVHYELSNYARPKKECKHNKIYWKNEDYLGLGAGACGKIGALRQENAEGIDEYMVLINKGRNAIIHEQKLSRKEEISETVFLGLRMLEGLNLARFKERFGKDFFILFEKEYNKLAGLKLLKEEKGSVTLTRTGLFLSNEVFVEFV